MKPGFSAIVALSFVSTIFAVGDHFPTGQGNTWLFSYVKSSGGWGTVQTDSGTVQWQMVLVTTEGIPPGIVTTTVTIRRIFNQFRIMYKPGGRMPDETAYDSVFSPPRTSVDTIYTTSSNQVTGVTLKGDTCWSFVHDPQSPMTAGRVSVRDTVLSCMGKTTSASIIDLSPCLSIYGDQMSYITAQDIGPVEYHRHSSPYLMDAFWREDWKLFATDVNTSIKPQEKPIAGTRSLRMLKYGKEVMFEGPVARTGKLMGSFYNVNGTLVGKFGIEISFPGFQHIKIPGAYSGGTAPASGPCIIKLMTPDNRGITGKFTNF